MTTTTCRKSFAKKDVYQIVTDQIISQMEAGIIPWVRDWSLGQGNLIRNGPRNYCSGKPYRGINILLLGTSQYKSQYWLTYKQATEAGGFIRKGEKSRIVVFYKPRTETIKDKETGEEKQIIVGFLLRYYNVFNIEQCDGLPAKENVETADDFPRIEDCEGFLAALKENAGLVEEYGNPAFSPRRNIVLMPHIKDFKSPEAYYHAYNHELVHWTGHPDRINRSGVVAVLDGKASFGSETYSQEELVAEIGSAFLCAMAGIRTDAVQQNTIAYLQSWIAVLKGDSRLIVKAAGQAQTAADYLCKAAGITTE